MVSKQNNYEKGIGLAILNTGLLEHIKGNFNLAISNNEKALAIFSAIKEDMLIAKTYAALGVNYWQIGENDKALIYLFKALKLHETLNLRKETAASYNQISMVYQSQEKIPLAEEFANKALTIAKGLPPNIINISLFHNIANINGMQGKYTEALMYDSIGLSWCDIVKVEFNKSMFYDNMANCYMFSGNFSKSIQYHLKAISIDSTFKNNKQIGDSYMNLASVYEELNDFGKAIFYFEKSVELCRKSGYKIGVKNALESLSKLYFKLGDTGKAYQYLKESAIVKDSIINNNSEQKIAELQTLFDTEKKKQEIAQQALKISQRNILLVILFFVLMVSLITYYLLYNRYKLKQERRLKEEMVKEEMKRSKAVLESEENERQRLARELHDGVGQLLSATKLNLSTLHHFNNEEAIKLQNSIEILDDSIKEIRNISHNMVPDVLLKFGLKKAIADFINRINQTKKININFECIGCNEDYLNDTSKLMLYRIIQESVNNTIKYAGATQLNIQLSGDDSEITLIMEDNGNGFDVEKAMEKDGIGLKNMQLRTDYLKGKMEINSSHQNGTTILIEIPLS
jgi:signal transduction histidine kinase/Tfp pilus assembly protein PilF